MNAKSKWLAGIAAACLFVAVSGSAAEDAAVSGPSLILKNQAADYSLKSSCGASRVLGLCADAESSGPRRILSLGLLKGIGNLVPKAAAPNKFLQLVKLFIDDLEVAQIGNTRIRLSIEIR